MSDKLQLLAGNAARSSADRETPLPHCRFRSTCRCCGAPDPTLVLDLGVTPLANRLQAEVPAASGGELRFPLQLFFCEDCGLVQLRHVVDAGLLYSGYPYVSSTSETLDRHFESLSRGFLQRRSLNASGMLVDIGGNDGLLLSKFASRGVKLVSIDPAGNIAPRARARGIEVIEDCFSGAIVRSLLDRGHRATGVLATNVVGHVDEPGEMFASVAALLAPDGLFVIEVPYLRDLLANVEFDTIYHEHLSYFSVSVLERLFASSGLRIVDVERVSIHGGSIRVFAVPVASDATPSHRVRDFIAEEHSEGLDTLETLQLFARRTQSLRRDLRALLAEIRSAGSSIMAYGAAAKGSTLLNYCEIGRETLSCVVDRNELKHGRMSPGVRLPICPVSRVLDEQPDYLLILAWNFAGEIMRQQREYRRRGGRFIVPLPVPKII